jgi:hypothetical protein
MIGGRKVVGSAQFRQGDAFLQHGSILLEDNQSFVLSLTRGAIIAQSSQQSDNPSRSPEAASLGSGMVAEAIIQAAGARWGGKWNRSFDPEPALHGAAALFLHYRSSAWTWAR